MLATKPGESIGNDGQLLLKGGSQLGNLLHGVQLLHALGDGVVVQLKGTGECARKVLKLALGALKGICHKVLGLVLGDGVGGYSCVRRDKGKKGWLISETILQFSKGGEQACTKGTDFILTVISLLLAKPVLHSEPVALQPCQELSSR
jgi:hypothetical protein